MYIAEITKQQQFNSKAIASLLGQKRKDGLWISVSKREIAINNRDLNLKQLILLELDSDFSPLIIISANEILVDCLRDFTLRITKLDSLSAGIELSKASLEYQALKFFRRDEDLKRRDELLVSQEKKLELLYELAQQKIDAADRQNEALKRAWEHIYYREEELKKTS